MSKTETGGAPDHSKGRELIAEIERRLKAEGVEIDNASVGKAISITTEVLLDAKEQELRAVRESLPRADSRVTRIFNWLEQRDGIMVLLLLGVGAMIMALYANFRKFQEGLWELFHSFSFGISDVLVSRAYAESGGVSAALPSVWPIAVYVVYLLFSIGYLVALYMWVKGDKDTKANAMEILKGLTAFFIGAVSAPR